MTKDNKIFLVVILLMFAFIGGMFVGKDVLQKYALDFDERLYHSNLHHEYNYSYCPYCGEYLWEESENKE